MPEFHLFLPQMRMTLDTIVERAQAAEGGGLHRHVGHGPPRAAARTRASDVRSDDHQHVAGRAHESPEGRQPRALRRVPPPGDVGARSGRHRRRVRRSVRARDRIGLRRRRVRHLRYRAPSRRATARPDWGRRSRCSRLLWSGESFSYEGQYFTITEGRQLPTPLEHIPIVVGGAGPRTMALVAEYADWWNCPLHRLDKLDEMRSRAGDGTRSPRSRWSRSSPTSRSVRRCSNRGQAPLRHDGRTLRRQCERARRHLRSTRRDAGSSASTCGSPTSPTRARSRRSVPTVIAEFD